MRRLALLLFLATAAPAAAAAPIMPLAQVRPGMQCTGLSVFKGTTVEPFDVRIDDVVGESTTGSTAPRLLVTVSGARIEPTGVGPGFSGSPILCPTADGSLANAGAISETINDYGGRQVLATPIEQILAVSTTPTRAPRSLLGRVRSAAVLSAARPLASPLTIGGVRPEIMRRLAEAASRAGVPLVAAAPAPVRRAAGAPFQPGSAVSAGLASGDITVGATGTVAYVDGPRTWMFGHGFDAAGARSMLLQGAYVAGIVNNPVGGDLSTYKYAGPVDDVGTVTNDGQNGVAGIRGALPTTTKVRVVAVDQDTDTRNVADVLVADETDVGVPTGIGGLSFAVPIAVLDTATDVLGGSPQQLTGTMCLTATLRGREKPLRFCNRYVSDGTAPSQGYASNPVALSASSDASAALALLDTFKGRPVHVETVTVRVTESRRQGQAYLRSLRLPRRVSPGETVPFALRVAVVRGATKTIRGRWTVPRSLRPGRRTITLRGREPDNGGGFYDVITIDLTGGGGPVDSEGPRTVGALAAAFAATHKRDGVRVRGRTFYRDPELRIAGQLRKRVTVTRPGRARQAARRP